MHNIRNFQIDDIKEAEKIAYKVWGDLYTNQSENLQNLIYAFMVHYYDLNRDFSFSVYDEKLKGFLLAAKKYDKNNSAASLNEKLKTLAPDEQKTINELLKYLHACGEAVKSNMNDDDIMLGLFISNEKGCGRILLSKLVETCKEKNIKNIYLWTDTTCDHDYYEKNNFTLVDKVKTTINNQKIDTIIYKKSCVE